MAQGKLQLKFERNQNMRFRDTCDTDDGTDGGQLLISRARLTEY